MRISGLLVFSVLLFAFLAGCSGSSGPNVVTEQDELANYAAEHPNPEGTSPD
ncbi:hypothetical protein [Allorhodopirellula heiligendammensis]|uniref:Secreted protein n=1 Tax=Allorhodopirellula heiligendammensis TaxID=2714739 RepID=A0A5C6C0R4_9BACT|nr:hypothetical protein [Allorhodopirellula heiligendammensis]TWU16754.1 hypothetical protein Poly21_39600 [Allorhodopirellula heiligendammensis]